MFCEWFTPYASSFLLGIDFRESRPPKWGLWLALNFLATSKWVTFSPVLVKIVKKNNNNIFFGGGRGEGLCIRAAIFITMNTWNGHFRCPQYKPREEKSEVEAIHDWYDWYKKFLRGCMKKCTFIYEIFCYKNITEEAQQEKLVLDNTNFSED